MLLIPKKKEEQTGSTFTETQAKSITYNVEDINSNLYGFFGTLNKRDKKNFLKTKVQHMQLMEQLNKGDDASNSPKKKEADKKWFKIVGIMAKGIGGLFKGVANIAKGLAGKATGILGFLLGIFIILKLGLLKTLIPAALDMLKTLVTGIIEVLPDIIKWAWDILKEWVPKLVNAFADAISDALGLSKESKLRKIMPILVGIGAGLFALFKVASMFGIGGKALLPLAKGLGTVFKSLLGGLKSLATFLIANPIALAIAAIVAAGVGIYAFVKNSEEISKWSKDKKKELEEQNKADLALIKKYQGTDLSKINAETYKQLKEATERQAGFWKDIKSATLTGVGATADAVTSYKNYVDEQDKLAFKLRMKQNRTRKEEAELQLAAVNSWQVFTSDYWKAFVNPDAWAEQFKYLWHILKKYIFIPVGNGIVYAITWMNDKIAGGVQYIKDSISDLWKTIKKKIQNIWKTIKKKIQNIWKTIIEPFSKFGNLIQSIGSTIASIWAKLPNPANIGTGISGLVTNMEDFFKPFSQKMAEIFGNIGDVFGAIVDHIMWGLSKAKIFDIDTHGAKTYEEYRSRQIIEKIRSDPKAVARVEDYGKAVASKDQAKIEAASAGMTTNEKELGSLLVQGNDNIGKYAAKLDRFISQELHSKAGSQVAVQKFFPELAPKELTRINPMYTER